MDATRFNSILGYNDRELAKQEGFSFDKESKRWFIESSHENFEQLSKKYEVIYLNVPYDDRLDAREKGAVWDSSVKKWKISKHRLESCTGWI